MGGLYSVSLGGQKSQFCTFFFQLNSDAQGVRRRGAVMCFSQSQVDVRENEFASLKIPRNRGTYVPVNDLGQKQGFFQYLHFCRNTVFQK